MNVDTAIELAHDLAGDIQIPWNRSMGLAARLDFDAPPVLGSVLQLSIYLPSIVS
jgi:hypothetical protein